MGYDKILVGIEIENVGRGKLQVIVAQKFAVMWLTFHCHSHYYFFIDIREIIDGY